MTLSNLTFSESQEESTEDIYREDVQVPNEPFIESAPIYNLLPANFRAFTSGSGSAGVESREFKTTTGTSVGGYGAIQSFRALNYKVGASSVGRFSAVFTAGVANSWQGVGFLNLGDELSFEYNGTEFGVWNRYGGLAEVRVLTVSAAASGAETVTLTLNSVGYSIAVTSGTTAHNAYEIAAWLNNEANQTVWKADQVDSTVIISAQSDGAKAGTYSISSTGTANGSFSQTTAGVTKTSAFVAAADWNTTTLPNLDPTKGNVYQIQYSYTGFGLTKYYVMNESSGGFDLVHVLRNLNNTVLPNIVNPSLRTGLYCVSLGSTTNLTVLSGGMSAYLQSVRGRTRNPRAFSNSQTLNTSTFTNIFTIRNRRVYNDLYNQVEIEPLLLTIGNEGTKNAIIELRATTNTGVEQNFTPIGTNLVSDSDVSSVTVTGGRLLAVVTVAGGTSNQINLSNLRIRAPPTLHLVV